MDFFVDAKVNMQWQIGSCSLLDPSFSVQMSLKKGRGEKQTNKLPEFGGFNCLQLETICIPEGTFLVNPISTEPTNAFRIV